MAYDQDTKDAMQREFALYVGMQLRLRRTELGLKISEVAEMTGITEASISRLERGELDVRLSTLALLRSALALEIDIDSPSKPLERRYKARN